KDVEGLVEKLCKQALFLPISDDDVKKMSELMAAFKGFDRMAVDEKKEKIRRGLEIIKAVSSQQSAVRVVAERRMLNAECYSLEEIKIRLSKLSTPLKEVKGIGPKLAQVFAKKGLNAVEDVLYWLPIRYEDRRKMKKISQLILKAKEVASGEIAAMGEVFYGRRRAFEIAISDGSGFLKLKWFHYRLPLMKKRYKIGQRLVVYGEVGIFSGQKEIIHPDVEIFENDDALDSINFNAIAPVYSQIGNMHQKTIRKIIRGIVDEFSSLVIGSVPPDVLKRYGLMELPNAVAEAHKPGGTGILPVITGWKPVPPNDWLPRKSIVFDELFSLEMGLALKQKKLGKEDGISFNSDSALVENFRNMLPFKLTAAQKRVVSEIKKDMSEPHPTNRLIQGDVGCGKTVVAFMASLIAIDNGYQSAIMAPTEILAEQHYLNIHKYAEGLGIKTALLTSSLTKSERKAILDDIKTGEINLAIGTHALIQEDVEFKRLGLVIVDEQHRFGVIQRAMLKKKGANPDILVMTATPIPRTLSMTVFGDLDVSVIDELPPGRRPVKTKVFREKEREQVYKIIRNELTKGRQVYIVYPLIEESEELDLRDATRMSEHLRKDIFTEYKIGLLHGKMKSDEKEAVMKAFKAREMDILVSTTVIEVGIDVSNATCMVVEHAERFGLSQLHQLRGRVGRGEHDSYCILLAGKIGSVDTYKRLKVMEETNDGFKIAEEDLKIRGPGDFLGTRQSGLPDFRVVNLLTDASLLQKARDEAFNLIKSDPEFEQEGHRVLKEIINARWKGRMELAQVG
ncbi:MAG: ATP-dependent DNA helicase RecG, partial [Deltaproteobacteria bacterium]